MLINSIKGALILLVLCIFAALFHSNLLNPLSYKSKFSVLNSESLVHSTPEQRFLVHGPLNINAVTAHDLDAIPRVSPKVARRIIEFRQQKGRINDLDELLEVKGVGPRTLKIIGEYTEVRVSTNQ